MHRQRLNTCRRPRQRPLLAVSVGHRRVRLLRRSLARCRLHRLPQSRSGVTSTSLESQRKTGLQ